MNKCKIVLDDNLKFLNTTTQSYKLIYIDPPYNTGKTQKLGTHKYEDRYDSYLDFIIPRLKKSYDVLDNDGSLFVHLDYREVHYVKVELDKIFGRDSFLNEIIWSYDYGARQKNKWPTKHDNILCYVKNPKNYIFNFDDMERIPYMAPGLVGKEKAEKGKTLTDVWWHTIVPTNGTERVGYPTQKPLGILNRIVKIHSNPNDELLDFFAGSGSFGESAILNNRNVTLVDQNPEFVNIVKQRLTKYYCEIL